MPALQVHQVRKEFDGKPVLQGISFDVEAGDVLAIIGPSGCGKTTLLRCILGEIEPDGGRIILDGQDISHQKVWKRGVGIVYQRYALFPHLTVAKNIAYGLEVRKASKEQIASQTRQLLDLVHLGGMEERYPEELSGGERQRVALARALAVKPKLLLLDEAFTALDATTRHKVIQEVRQLVRRFRVTTVLVTHDQEEAFLFSNRVLVLNEGRPIVMGSPEQVMVHPHPFIRDFVKMALFERGTVKRDARRGLVVPLENGSLIPIQIPGVKAGDTVHVMVKKSGDQQSIEVWPHAPGH